MSSKLNSTCRIAVFLAAMAGAGSASAQTTTYLSSQIYTGPLIYLDPSFLLPAWTCKTGTGASCTAEQLDNPTTYRQIVIFPTGYTSAEKGRFYTDAETLRVKMVDTPGTTVWSEAQRSKLLFLNYWVGGGELGTPTSAFGGKVFPHPIRGYALTMNQDAAIAKVNAIRNSTIPEIKPAVLTILFDTMQDVTNNATPPSYTRQSYGIARVTVADAQGHYIGAHEMGHGLLSWVDEYIEEGFQNMNITQFDIATPLAIWDGSLGTLDNAVGDLLGVYDLNISEILASNGADNVATSRWPATVYSGLSQDVYEYEGGMFFGRGTWHDTGLNIMNSTRYTDGIQNGFAYAHSPSQQRIINTVFTTHTAGRANDRLRNSGPVNGWPLEFGSATTVLFFDADKNHRWHPTKRYDVLVGWYERDWYTCWAGPFPYPCYDWVWTTAQKSITPTVESLQLKTSTLYGLASLTQAVVCDLGLGDIGGNIDLCTLTLDEMSDAFLPTLVFYLPYQYTTVPASQWFTTYYWAFRTYNGTYTSGWTGWASFYRSF